MADDLRTCASIAISGFLAWLFFASVMWIFGTAWYYQAFGILLVLVLMSPHVCPWILGPDDPDEVL